MMLADGSASRREERERHRCRKSRNKRPSKHPARAKHANQCGRAERTQNRAQRVHRALETECATLLIRSNAIREQRIA
jgi:hypothetical protein